MLMSWVFVLLVCLIAFFNHLPLDTGWLLHLVVGVAKCSSLTGLLGYAHWLFRIAFAPAWQPYRIGYLFTHKNGDFGAISVAERSCAAPSPCRSRRWSVTYQIGSLSHFGVVGTGTQMCPSPSPSNVELRVLHVFWSTETTVIPKSTLGKGKITQVFQDLWRVALIVSYSKIDLLCPHQWV